MIEKDVVKVVFFVYNDCWFLFVIVYLVLDFFNLVNVKFVKVGLKIN